LRLGWQAGVSPSLPKLWNRLTLACGTTINLDTFCHPAAPEMPNRSQRTAQPFRLFSSRWWGCLSTTLLFAFYANYIPAHLATAAHLDDLVGAVLHSVLHPHHHDHGPSGQQNDNHDPHPALDHSLAIAARNRAPAAVVPVIFVPPEVLVHFHSPALRWNGPLAERVKPPGESPPGPAQPRAPPLA
jgi:hypothetical protein